MCSHPTRKKDLIQTSRLCYNITQSTPRHCEEVMHRVPRAKAPVIIRKWNRSRYEKRNPVLQNQLNYILHVSQDVRLISNEGCKHGYEYFMSHWTMAFWIEMEDYHTDALDCSCCPPAIFYLVYQWDRTQTVYTNLQGCNQLYLTIWPVKFVSKVILMQLCFSLTVALIFSHCQNALCCLAAPRTGQTETSEESQGTWRTY